MATMYVDYDDIFDRIAVKSAVVHRGVCNAF